MHPWNCIFISPSNAEGSFPARKTIAAKAFLLTTQHREFGVISTSSSINYTHKRPLCGHCAPPLQKPSQSVCTFGLTSWGFMVNSIPPLSQTAQIEMKTKVRHALVWYNLLERRDTLQSTGKRVEDCQLSRFKSVW